MIRKIPSFAVFIVIQLFANYCESAEATDQLTLEAGRPGSASHQLGVGLTSLVKVIVLPHKGIDLELANQDSTLDDEHLLIVRQAELQTLLAGQPADAFRSVMTFRSHDADDELILELIARADVSTNTIYDVTRAIFENGPFLNTINDRDWDLSMDQAMHGLQFPIHQGALRYYRESGGLEEQIADSSPSDVSVSAADQGDAEFYGESTFYLYFGRRDVHLDRAKHDQIAAACRYAAISQTSLIRISGHLSELTSDVAESVAGERLQSVKAALDQDTNCSPETSIVILSEAEATLPAELLEASDDRIEIKIMLPQKKPQ